MNVLMLVSLWNEQIENYIKLFIEKKEYNDGLKEYLDKKYFWFAYLWILILNRQYRSNVNENYDLKQFFKFIDTYMSSYPDLFKEYDYMKAHQVIWKKGAKIFFQNSLELEQIVINVFQNIKL